MKQNLINIFENNAGSITVQYASIEDADGQNIDIQTISFSTDDLESISQGLKYAHEQIQLAEEV